MSPRKSNESADAAASVEPAAARSVATRIRAHLERRAGELAAVLRAVGRGVPMAGWVFVVCFLVYSHRPLVQSSMDNQPLRWGAALLASQGTLNFANMGIDASRFYSMRTMPDGSIRSHTPIGTALLGAPVFWAARKLGMEFTSENVVFLDALAAALLMAASAAMMFHLARRHGRRTAWFLALAFAFGTANWSTASRCLWQHTGAQFSLLAALVLLHGDRARLLRLAGAAAMLALAAWCRPFVAPACAIIFAAEFLRSRLAAKVGLGVAAAGAVAWVGYNLYATGNPLGTYVSSRVFAPDLFANYPRYLLGSLVSPNRGLVPFAPVLLIGLVAVPVALAKWRSWPREAVFALCALVGLLMRGFTPGWFGGHTYGSRYMLDSALFLLLAAAPLVRPMLVPASWRTAVPAVLLALSAGVQYLGVARDYESWNIVMGMNVEKNAWEWRRNQVRHVLTYGESTRGPLLDPANYVVPPNGVIDPKGNPRDLRFFRYGLTIQAPWGPWIMPPRAGMVVNIPESAPLRLRAELTTEAFQFDPTVIRYFWNGTEFAQLVILHGDTEFRNVGWLKVPAELVRPGLNEIEFRVSRAYYPQASPAALGAALNRVIILPDTGE